MGEHINPAKFINKTVLTEEIEHFVPEHNFSDFKIQESLKKAIEIKGYRLPTPIQDRTIPHILQGGDIVGVANTGTGKTAAFLIPAINKVLLNRREQVLVIVPTRELAIQIEEELKGFTPGMKIFSVCCVGGASISRQISQLRYQYNFIIGTPGRLKDLIERRMIRLSEFSTLVLDEADRMLDMGFVNDMRFVVAGMPKARQTMFFSATVSHDIEKLIGEFLREPVRISVKTQDTAKNVEQDVVRIDRGSDKATVLANLLSQKEFNKVLVFGRTKHGVEKLATLLTQKGFKAESIHGNKNHAKRQQALRLFKSGNVQVLVATDVAARGLDIADVSHVINFDIPATYDDYVHRIGRTGRGNKKGKALTFLG
jgi:superfamily II DNA/RNA helicase